ncbi:MAG: Fic family protein [Nitrospirae bacterium]|nr:Fic family protein [Nitrospirota bacterium]MCL5977973.1 Fic family protein [Nitrospirota bacterium]
MDIEAYKSGRLEKGFNYSYFVPESINRQLEWKDPQLSTLLEKASISMGELNSFARLVPNIDLFIQLHVTKEAVISSRIEGTQTNMDEALMPEEEISPERRNDWLEVRNYSEAMGNAIKELEHIPLSSRLLCKAHERLLAGVRGEHKMPGEFRTSQNWIGGASLNDAVFIPPAHTYVNELMGDLENFLHNESIHVPALIRTGIAHYQFETIHPFLDGNGRIGRLMITLYLVSQKILHQPLLYLSVFFEKNKSLYYDNLTRVREKNDLMRWLKYFLTGVDETARQASNTLSDILKLKEQVENTLRGIAGRRTHSALALLTHLFKEPFINVRQAEGICDLSKKAANDLVNLFVQQGILKEISGKTRYRLFLFAPYVDLFK